MVKLNNRTQLMLSVIALIVAMLLIVMTVSISYAVLVAFVTGDQIDIPTGEGFLFLAVATIAFFIALAAVLKIIGITVATVKKRKRAKAMVQK